MDTEIDYSERAIALLDILGFKATIEKLGSDKSVLSGIMEALSYLQEKQVETYDTLSTRLLGERLPSETAETTIFSDHIVLSDTIEKLHSILFKATLISRGLFRRGMLCRGAVTCGYLYHKNQIVFGNALLDAIEIESSKAIYPRVVASDDVVQLYKDIHSIRKAPKLLSQDADGLWIISPFSTIAMVAGTGESYFADARKFITEGMLSNYKNQHVIEKYRWIAAQFNQSKHGISNPINLMDTYRKS